MSGPAYSISLYKRDGTSLGELPGAQLDSVEWALSGIGDLNFTMKQTDDRIADPLLGEHEIGLFIDGWPDPLEVPWQGPLLTEDGNSRTVAFSASSLEFYLSKRYIDFNSLYFDGATLNADGTVTPAPVGFAGYDQAVIATGLLNYSQGIALPAFGITTVDADKGYRMGTEAYVATGKNRLRKYLRQDHANIMDLMNEFPTLVNYTTGAPDGFDWSFKQYRDGHRAMQIYSPRRGQLQSNLTAELGRNIADFSIKGDATNLVTRAICSGGSTGTQKLENEYKDATASAKYGEQFAVTSDNDQKDPAELGAKARSYVQARNHPQVESDIQMLRMPVELLGVLMPGDTLPIVIQKGRYNITQARRILKVKWQVRPNNLQLTLQPALDDNS